MPDLFEPSRITQAIVTAEGPRRSPSELHAAMFLARFRNPRTRNGYAITLRQWIGCASNGCTMGGPGDASTSPALVRTCVGGPDVADGTPPSAWCDRTWSAPLADDEYRAIVSSRLLSNIAVDAATDCWVWQRYVTPDGYGRISVKARMVRAHAVALMIARGSPWPTDLQVDHLCRNRACCNPDHLELVTSAENTRRGDGGPNLGARQRAKTHCPKGHAYDEANTSIGPRGYRRCRKCHAEQERARARARRSGA